MTTTSYSVELQDFDLSADAKQRIDAALKSTVMAELAKLDFGSGERSISANNLPSGVMGVFVRNQISAPERSFAASVPTTPLQIVGGDAMLLPIHIDFGDLEVICMRPDVHEAIISNSQAFLELLSNDEQASKNFNALLEKAHSGEVGSERNPTLVAVAVAATAFAVGLWVGRYT